MVESAVFRGRRFIFRRSRIGFQITRFMVMELVAAILLMRDHGSGRSTHCPDAI